MQVVDAVPRKLISASVQWAVQIMRKIDTVLAND
jgi:hypothetical protein